MTGNASHSAVGRGLRRFGRSRLAVALAASTVTALAVGGFAYAAIPGSDGTITACYKNAGGNLRVINAPTATCATGETKLVWNQKGVAGPKGATGATGAKGATGATGARGPAGPAGSLDGGACVYQGRAGVVSHTVGSDEPTVTLQCDPVFYVSYDGTTDAHGTPLKATLTGGRKGPGCTPATLSCNNTTDFVTYDTVHVKYACSSSCPYTAGKTLNIWVGADLGGGGTGNEHACTVANTAGVLGCTIDLPMQNPRVLGLSILFEGIS